MKNYTTGNLPDFLNHQKYYKNDSLTMFLFSLDSLIVTD